MDSQPAASTAPAGSDNPLPQPEVRTCAKCEATKVCSPETWVYKKNRKGHYAVYGRTCLECDKKRKVEYEARRDKIAALVADVPSAPAKGDAEKKDKQREALTHSKMDVAKALKAGSKVLNEMAPSVLALMLEYLEDRESPHHRWALEHFADRIMPRKLYEELGGSAAGVGALADKRPVFALHIHQADPTKPIGATYENGEMPAGLLPSPPEESEAG